MAPPSPDDTEHVERGGAPKGLYLIVALLLASAVFLSLRWKGSGRLDRARAAAGQYGLLEVPPPGPGIDLLPWAAKASGWVARHSPDDESSARLGPAVLGELLTLGDELVAMDRLGRLSGEGWAGLAHDSEDPVRLLDAFRVGRILLSAAKGEAPALSPDQRVDALVAVLCLADALTERHIAGLMVAAVLVDEARRGFDATLGVGLTMNPEQRAQLLRALDRLDLEEAAVQRHSGSVAAVIQKKDEDPSSVPSRGSLPGLLYRFSGRSSYDEAVALELAVLTHRNWTAEDKAERAQALTDHKALVDDLDLEELPLASYLGSMLHTRLAKVRVTAALLLAWKIELRYPK